MLSKKWVVLLSNKNQSRSLKSIAYLLYDVKYHVDLALD